MRYPIESVVAWMPVSLQAIEEKAEGYRYELINRLAHEAYLTAVEAGKPRRCKVGHYKSRFRHGRFIDFISMCVTTEQPDYFYFARNVSAYVMRARAMYTRNRRARWTPRRKAIAN